jgi:ABC-type lipoprotein export system ATPase subunit
MTECLLTANKVAKIYDDGRIQALRGIDLRVDIGEFLAITGPSGSGKSTLLQLLGGLDHPTSGNIEFKGKPLSPGFDFDSYRSSDVGFVFQAFHLIPTLSAVENVQLPMFETKLNAGERRKKAETLLRTMSLDHRFAQYPNELSAGERQRVAIARSLANDPQLLLADEPTGNLDSDNSDHIMKLLTQVQSERNMTLIVVTHEAQIAATAHRQIKIRDGRVDSGDR